MSDQMKATKGKKDNFSNKAYGTVSMSAANTLTFAQIQMAVGLFQGIAMNIHRILWYPQTSTIREMVAATDSLYMALTTSNRLSSLTTVAEPAILAQKRWVGIAANVEMVRLPEITDFTDLPGGGKITSANPLFVGMFSGGFAAAGAGDIEIEFTFVQLSDRDYLEIIQSQFPANIT
jgi:hypothetical protein